MTAGKGDRSRPIEDRHTYYSNFVRAFNENRCGASCPHPQISEPCSLTLNHTGLHFNGIIEWENTPDGGH